MPTQRPNKKAKSLDDILIIFDCDGTLVDSESLASIVIEHELQQLGIPITNEEIVREFTGKSTAENVGYVEKTYDVKLPDEFRASIYAKMQERFRIDLLPIEGVPELLNSLTSPRCVASNGPHQQIVNSLTTTNILHHFKQEHIFSAHDIQKWKPEPDLFLWAASSCGFTPQNCIVIEDSLVGYQAALHAGMRVVFHRPPHVGHSEQVQSEYTISSMEQLMPLLQIMIS